MPINRTPPDAEAIRRWFIDVAPVPPRTFEFALVLGGTGSAGAYTAGAIDFLIEALDCFEAAKAQGQAPRHDVVLKLIAGTSGGGVNAAIAARALAYKFPHISRGTPIQGNSSGNPFYDTWINVLRLEGFLDTGDIGSDVVSILNGKPIDDGAAKIVGFAPGGSFWRPWIPAPLGIILTLTSLRGIPYRLNFDKELSESYVDHADHIRFANCLSGPGLLRAASGRARLGV